MSKKIFKILLVIGIALFSGVAIHAQDGADLTYSPYSVFGVGDLLNQGTVVSRSMGGVGVATRNRRHLNYLNPASVTARDSLFVMVDVGLNSNNKIFRQGDIRSAHNSFNLTNLAFSVPIYKKSAFVAGITPYSNVAYDFSSNVKDSEMIAQTGKINTAARGNGGLYSIFAGPAVTLWNRLSFGVQAIYYFGNIDKESATTFHQSSYRNFSSGYIFELNAFTGKFGVQYEQPFGNNLSMVVGATYKPKARLHGYVTDYKYVTLGSKVDTSYYKVDTLSKNSSVPKLASEIGFGVSLRGGERWSVEFNYLRSDWTKSSFDKVVGFSNKSNPAFSPAVSNSFRLGFEFVPNRNDIRYYLKKCTYRGGIYYDNEYYKIGGRNVSNYGITFGMTLPIFKLHDAITLGLDIGKRGSIREQMTRETYFQFNIGFNISDRWFIKQTYQ